MPPHPALQVPEILSIIFGNFYGENFTDEDSLAALARTCKAFFEPAVSVLWRRLESLATLFNVIPSFEFDESRGIYGFHDDVEPAHWLRLESYAAAIHELQVTTENPYGFDGFVLVLAARHFQGRPMLPSLVTLTLDHPDLIPALPLLLSPTLRTVSFCFCDAFSIGKLPYPLHKGFMKVISEQAPSIEKLVLPGFLSNRESYNPILNLRNLHTLIISKSEINTGNVPLDIIASSASLVELEMNFSSTSSDASPLDLKFQLPCFQSLRSLSLTGASGLFINSILTIFSFIPIESVLIRLECSDVQWRTITTSVAQWANTVQRFEFIVRSGLMILPRYSDLEPLLSCHQMRHLIVKHYPFPSSPSLSHDNIVEMATAWPELRELKLQLATVGVNLKSLTLLTKKLPSLRELSLSVDFSTLPARIVKRPRRTGEQLLKLDINHFSLGKSDPVTVADHLNNLFPFAAIDTIYTESPSSVHKLGRVLNLCHRACTRAGVVFE